MKHILDLDEQSAELNDLFRSIKSGNTILFLGAGASVGEKMYLSQQIIEYYEAELGNSLNTKNITEFVDILSANEKFSRKHYDDFVVRLLQKLNVTEAHKILASIPWREIITTNYDLLVERAYDEVAKSYNQTLELKTVKSLQQNAYRESNNEVKYIKLNGCIQDTSLYPLAFSTDDFTSLKPFYKNVLNDLKNLSPAISFLSIGYSFSDSFGKELLEKFDSYNYRDKKWLINVDPFVNENSLPYYTKNKVCIIKCTFAELMERYKRWEQDSNETIVRKKGLSIRNSNNSSISLPAKLLINLENIVKQLNIHTNDRFVKEIDYYKGEEPTFNLITRDVDVVKTKYLDSFENTIKNSLEDKSQTFLPIFFVTGDFGIGKSTFTLRLIYELEKKSDLDLVAFEILDYTRLKRENIVDLIKYTKSKNIIFYSDEIEIENNFKSLLDLQRDLSIEQFQDCNIYFLAPIRENILHKHKLSRSIPRNYELKFEGKLSTEEIDDLLEKLKSSGLIQFRDASEKKQLTQKVQKDFASDSFISLMAIITSGRHENDLISSFNELSPVAQKAFLFTALLHRHKLLMPANWLKHNISLNWEDFVTKIVKAEGKGILIQEIKSTKGTQPDLYFRTKHPIIAEKLVNRFIPSIDKQFANYEKMLRTVDVGQTSSYLVNNLLKILRSSQDFNDKQINKLYEAANTKLSDDPYFLLNYATNLQNRGTKNDIKKAINTLVYAESLLDKRNHKFIHRRAVLSFELAKIYHAEETQLNYTLFYLSEAKELFEVKKLLDPFSSFSYVDYIKMLIWGLNNIVNDEEDDIQKQILIEELLDIAKKTVTDHIDKIHSVHISYSQFIKQRTEDTEYKEYLDNLNENPRLRPYVAILLYNYHIENDDIKSATGLISQIEAYQENFEVVKFLFKYYGRRLYNVNIRLNFFELVKNNRSLENDNPLRYNYFNFVAECYNFQYAEGKKHLAKLQAKHYNLNPEYQNTWLNSDGVEVLFDAIIVRNDNEKYKAVKISHLQLTARLVKGNYESLSINQSVKVKIHFYLSGILAEIAS